MQRSEAIDALAKALCAAQAEMPVAPKQSNNPHFGSKFAGLPEVREVAKTLHKHGLSFVQPTSSPDPQSVMVETVLLHTSGQWLSSSLTLRPVKQDPQGFGSAITYARRYSLCALVGIVADEDDDGNAASTHEKPAQGRKPNVMSDAEKKAALLIENLAGGFASKAEKEKWRDDNKAVVEGLPASLQDEIKAEFKKAEVRS